MPGPVDERDPRVFFAIERTFLAWTRTALALMGFGFVVARLGLFLRQLPALAGEAGSGAAATGMGNAGSSPSLSLWLGTALVALGIVVQLVSLMHHRAMLGRFDRGESLTSGRSPLPLLTAICLMTVGAGLVLYLVTLG